MQQQALTANAQLTLNTTQVSIHKPLVFQHIPPQDNASSLDDRQHRNLGKGGQHRAP